MVMALSKWLNLHNLKSIHERGWESQFDYGLIFDGKNRLKFKFILCKPLKNFQFCIQEKKNSTFGVSEILTQYELKVYFLKVKSD